MPPHATLPIARAALAELGLESARLRLINDGYNTTWRVQLPDRRLALRLTRAGPSLAYVAAEAAWIRAVDRDLDLHVCAPEGLTLTQGRACLLTRWVPGAARGRRLTASIVHRVGVAMAALHDQAEAWSPPEGWSRPRLEDPWLGEPSPLSSLPAEAADVFGRCAERLRPMLEGLVAERCHVLHADLHGGNYRVGPGDAFGVLDFDDCAQGHPAQDVGISFFYMRNHPRYPAFRRAFEAGYRTRRPWPTDDFTVQAMGAWRAISTLAHVLPHANPDVRGWGEARSPEWLALCRSWLDA